MAQDEKACVLCRASKPVSQFHRDRRQPDGLWYYCNPCQAARGKRYRKENDGKIGAAAARRYQENKAAINAGRAIRYQKMAARNRERPILESERWDAEKRCSHCCTTKPLAMFYRLAKSGDGHQSWCALCVNAERQAWYRRNRERALIGIRKRKLALLQTAGFHTQEDVAAIRSMQRDRCACCRIRLRGCGDVDHIVPISRGGSDWPSNLQLLCKHCNRSKHTKDQSVFMRERGFLL